MNFLRRSSCNFMRQKLGQKKCNYIALENVIGDAGDGNKNYWT